MGWGRREGWGVDRGRNLLAQMELPTTCLAWWQSLL